MSIRVFDPACIKCEEPRTDTTSRAILIGPKCRRDMTPEQLRAAAARAAKLDAPFAIPAERPPSHTAGQPPQRARPTDRCRPGLGGGVGR